MNKVMNEKTIIVLLLIVVAVLLFLLYNAKDSAGIQDTIGLKIGSDGKFQIVAPDGNRVPPVSFKEHLVNHVKKYEEAGKDWSIEKGSTLTVFQIKGSRQIWIVWDNENVCLEFNDNGKFIGLCN